MLPKPYLSFPSTGPALARVARPAPAHLRALRRAPAATASAAAPASVTIRVNHRVAFGQVVKVVGEARELGGWNPKEAPGERPQQCPPRRRFAMVSVLFNFGV